MGDDSEIRSNKGTFVHTLRRCGRCSGALCEDWRLLINRGRLACVEKLTHVHQIWMFLDLTKNLSFSIHHALVLQNLLYGDHFISFDLLGL